jgi:hypothetical protein
MRKPEKTEGEKLGRLEGERQWEVGMQKPEKTEGEKLGR